MRDEEPTVEDLEAFAALAPELQPGGDGETRLVSAFYQRHIMVSFDWPAWQDEARRLGEPGRVATASLEEVRRLLTVHVRKDRFCEGHLAAVIGSGQIAELLGRMAVIVAERRAGGAWTRVRVEQGDITRVATDAIVNAANSALSGGGGVDGAIHRAAGPELLAACRALGRCPAGEARITPGFRLPARWVIHAVGPVWSGGDAGEPAQLASVYRASLELAVANGCKTIAFPAISCGAYGYPIKAAAGLAVETIRAWCAAHPGIDEVVLVAFERQVAEALQRALA